MGLKQISLLLVKINIKYDAHLERVFEFDVDKNAKAYHKTMKTKNRNVKVDRASNCISVGVQVDNIYSLTANLFSSL